MNKCNKINGPKDVAIGQIKTDLIEDEIRLIEFKNFQFLRQVPSKYISRDVKDRPEMPLPIEQGSVLGFKWCADYSSISALKHGMALITEIKVKFANLSLKSQKNTLLRISCEIKVVPVF